MTLADLSRPSILPKKNAATYLRRAEADLAAIEKETMNVHSASERPGFLMPPEDRQTVKAALAAYPKVVPLLEQAAACSDYSAELDYTLPPQKFLTQFLEAVQNSRSGTRVLSYGAALLVADGDRDEAVRTALLIFSLARHFDHNPLLVGSLVATAIRGSAIQSTVAALQTGPISKEVRNALDTELAIQERMDGFVWAMKSERAYTLESFRNIIPGRNFWLVGRSMWNMQQSACLELFSTLIAQASDPGPYRKVEQRIEGKNATMAALLSPSLEVSYAAVARTRAEIRSLRVLNALQTCVPAGSNKTPKLSELALPIEAMTDPFTGQSLHVKETPQGWLVYSVGPNLRDDGGELDVPRDGDVGVGPPPATAQPASGTDSSAHTP